MGPRRRETEDAIEVSFKNNDEAHALLDLINAECQSDPTSTQCFDRLIVERVRACVASRADYLKNHSWMKP